MKLKEYITVLKEIEQTHPDVDVVCSSDDEGNSFGAVHYYPALGRFDGHTWSTTEGELEGTGEKANAVCLN